MKVVREMNWHCEMGQPIGLHNLNGYVYRGGFGDGFGMNYSLTGLVKRLTVKKSLSVVEVSRVAAATANSLRGTR